MSARSSSGRNRVHSANAIETSFGSGVLFRLRAHIRRQCAAQSFCEDAHWAIRGARVGACGGRLPGLGARQSLPQSAQLPGRQPRVLMERDVVYLRSGVSVAGRPAARRLRRRPVLVSRRRRPGHGSESDRPEACRRGRLRRGSSGCSWDGCPVRDTHDHDLAGAGVDPAPPGSDLRCYGGSLRGRGTADVDSSYGRWPGGGLARNQRAEADRPDPVVCVWRRGNHRRLCACRARTLRTRESMRRTAHRHDDRRRRECDSLGPGCLAVGHLGPLEVRAHRRNRVLLPELRTTRLTAAPPALVSGRRSPNSSCRQPPHRSVSIRVPDLAVP